MAHCISDRAGRAAAAARRGLRAGLGDRLGGPRQRPPAADPRPARRAARAHLRRPGAVRHRALEARGARRYAGERPLAWIDDSLDESCHAWAAARAAPTLLVPTESDIGLTEAHTEALLALGARRLHSADALVHWSGQARQRGRTGGRIPSDLLPDGDLEDPCRALLYLVWWAFRAETVPEEAPPEPEEHRFGRFRPEPRRPRGPRRGGHGPDACRCPHARPAGASAWLRRPRPSAPRPLTPAAPPRRIPRPRAPPPPESEHHPSYSPP